jgi:solute carrier family 25 carnitine/acylcarnitine transporter 20/29
MNDKTIVISGACAGLAQVLTGHPFDTVKVRYVSQNYKNILECINHIRTEGYKNFYRGISSPLLGSVVMNVQTFYTYNYFKQYHDNLVAGSLTGIALSLIESPTDLIKSRMQVNSTLTYVETIKNIGYKNIYKGLGITTFRNFVSVGLYFWGYETTKSLFTNEYIGSFIGGSVGGFLCWGPNYPMDNIKIRYQTDTTNIYRGIIDCIRKTYIQEGVKTFWKGIVPCVARAMVINPFVFLAYEVTVKKFQ